jgi:hypothetical protein
VLFTQTMTGTLQQRVRVPVAGFARGRTPASSTSIVLTLDEIIDMLTLKQRQLSPLAQPGTLTAWHVAGPDLLVPKMWALQNMALLGITELADEQFAPVSVDDESMQLLLPHGLRPHQQTAVDAVVAELQSTPYGGGACITMYCGAGKSVTALAVAARMAVRTLIITHTSVLAAQWKESVLQYCPEAVVGSIVQDTFNVEGCTHVIGSLHSLAGREYPMDTAGIGLLVVDEVSDDFMRCAHLQ